MSEADTGADRTVDLSHCRLSPPPALGRYVRPHVPGHVARPHNIPDPNTLPVTLATASSGAGTALSKSAIFERRPSRHINPRSRPVPAKPRKPRIHAHISLSIAAK